MGIGKRIDVQENKKIKREIYGMKNSKKEQQSEIEFFPEEPKYTFDDIILSKEIKDKILDVSEYAENSKIVFETWGLQSIYKTSKRIGINLYGAPGTGKTMAAHAIAKHLDRKILTVNYADIESKYVGDTPKNIRKAFEAAEKTKSILFFDEADAILSKRVTNMSNATDVSVNQTRSVMLMLMNDYQDFIIFATNFINNFDPAFMRRISMHIEFKLPTYEERLQLWKHYILPTMPNNFNVEELARRYDGISGSDISNAILMAAFKAARQKAEFVEQQFVFDMIESTLKSKNANEGVKVETREVTEEYVKHQVENGEGVIIK